MVESFDSFEDQALKPEYDPWNSVDVHGREHNIQQLSRSYKTVRVAIDGHSSSIHSVVLSQNELAVQCRIPAQRLAETG